MHAGERREMYTEFQSETPNGRGHLGALGVDKGIILKGALNKYGITEWTGFIHHRSQTNGRHCYQQNNPSCAIKRGQLCGADNYKSNCQDALFIARK